MDIKLKIAVTVVLSTLILFQNCSQYDSIYEMQALSSSTGPGDDDDNTGGNNPPPVVNPPVVPPAPVGPSFVCEHIAVAALTSYSKCFSHDTKVNFDEMEKYVFANNPHFSKQPVNGVLVRSFTCKSEFGNSQPAGYPVEWSCRPSLEASSAYPLVIENPESLYESRTEAAVRPASGYRSYLHFDAPFRCFGGRASSRYAPSGENEFYVYSRTKRTCYFNNDQISAEALADATADVNYFRGIRDRSRGVNATGIMVATGPTTCTVKTIMIGPEASKNIPINVLECSYADGIY